MNISYNYFSDLKKNYNEYGTTDLSLSLSLSTYINMRVTLLLSLSTTIAHLNRPNKVNQNVHFHQAQAIFVTLLEEQ